MLSHSLFFLNHLFNFYYSLLFSFSLSLSFIFHINIMQYTTNVIHSQSIHYPLSIPLSFPLIFPSSPYSVSISLHQTTITPHTSHTLTPSPSHTLILPYSLTQTLSPFLSLIFPLILSHPSSHSFSPLSLSPFPSLTHTHTYIFSFTHSHSLPPSLPPSLLPSSTHPCTPIPPSVC